MYERSMLSRRQILPIVALAQLAPACTGFAPDYEAPARGTPGTGGAAGVGATAGAGGTGGSGGTAGDEGTAGVGATAGTGGTGGSGGTADDEGTPEWAPSSVRPDVQSSQAFECEEGGLVDFKAGLDKITENYRSTGPTFEIEHPVPDTEPTKWYEKFRISDRFVYETTFVIESDRLLMKGFRPEILNDGRTQSTLGGCGEIADHMCDITCSRTEFRTSITCGSGPNLRDDGFWEVVETVDLEAKDLLGQWNFCGSGQLVWYYSDDALVPVAFDRDLNIQGCRNLGVYWKDQGYCWSVPGLAR